MSNLLIQYVIKAAIRDRLLLSLLTLLILAASLSVFFGSSIIIEQDQTALVFAGGSLRLVGVMGLVLFVVFFINRSFEGKDIEFLLTRPIGRVEFLLSYATGLTILAALISLAQFFFIFALGPHLFDDGTLLWCISILVENIIMVIVALFFALVISSAAVAAMCTFAFYVLCRMMGQILGIIDAGTTDTSEILEFTMQVVSSLMPRLDLMGQTSWLIYGFEGGISYPFLIIQGLVFAFLILAAAMIDLVKRQF